MQVDHDHFLECFDLLRFGFAIRQLNNLRQWGRKNDGNEGKNSVFYAFGAMKRLENDSCRGYIYALMSFDSTDHLLILDRTEVYMSVQSDLVEYQRCLGYHLTNLQDQVRNLIGQSHWLSDGEHKEAILRKSIKARISEEFHVGTGFAISDDGKSSSQIDILITNKFAPCLFQEGDFRIVSMDVVRSIVEVKTKQSLAKFKKALKKVSNNAFLLRSYYGAVADNLLPSAGLFIYDDSGFEVQENMKDFVSLISEKNRFVNWICFGDNYFIRYWHRGDRIQYCNSLITIPVPQYRLYRLHGLSMAYFVNNVVWDCYNPGQNVNRFFTKDMSGIWFPVEEGKESRFVYGVSINNCEVNIQGQEIERV